MAGYMRNLKPAGVSAMTGTANGPRKPVKTWTMRDAVRLLFSGEKLRKNFLDARCDRSF
jgi:hypothetical protein